MENWNLSEKMIKEYITSIDRQQLASELNQFRRSLLFVVRHDEETFKPKGIESTLDHRGFVIFNVQGIPGKNK